MGGGERADQPRLPAEVAGYGGGRDARVPQGGQREACVALGEAFAFGIAEQGQVHIGGAGIAEEIEHLEM